jgi:hypothetical protein
MTPLEDAGAPKERPYGVGGLGAKVEPMVGPCLVDLKRTRVVLTGSVLADDLNEFPVARTLRIGDENTVKRCIFPPNAAETNLYHLYCSLKVFGETLVASRSGLLASLVGPARTRYN